LPFMIQCWPSRYLLYPRNRIRILTPKKVVPRGLPRC
jgi:hypothetical protein